jgi:hypothetical protein
MNHHDSSVNQRDETRWDLSIKTYNFKFNLFKIKKKMIALKKIVSSLKVDKWIRRGCVATSGTKVQTKVQTPKPGKLKFFLGWNR